MVAGIQGPDPYVSGIHRTFLDHQGHKASVSSPKMMLGTCAGGAVRLARSDNRLALTEGIETGLSVQQATGIPTWACLSTSGLRAVVVPPSVVEVVIFADGDAPGEEAALIAAHRLTTEGRRVRIARPPVGSDFNDVLTKEPGDV
jgi:DNA primase